MMVEGSTVICGNAKDLHIEVFENGEIIMCRRRIAAKPALEEREGNFDGVEVRGIGRQELEFQASGTRVRTVRDTT